MALTPETVGLGCAKINVSPVAILTTLKLICSSSVTAISVKISGIVDDGTLCRCAENGVSQVLNFSVTGAQTCEKMEISTPVTLNRK